MSSISTIRHRVRQGVTALFRRATPATDILASDWLAGRELGLFRRMSDHDRAHAARVASRLLSKGHSEPALIAAALLHDLAKAGTPEYPGRVRLPDRVLRVVLGRVTPGILARLAAHPPGPLRRGLYLAVHHARLGAVTAAQAGSSERTCWLIAHHEDRMPDDDRLRALIAADAALA